MKILIATTNEGKYKEMIHTLADLPFEFLSLKDLNTEIKIINFFSIPLHVSGTISNPKPDYFDSIVFLEDEISGSAVKDVFGVLKLPKIVLEKALYNSDILFQGVAP